MELIRKNIRGVAAFLLLQMVSFTLIPFQSMALTGGPSQPESEGFKPVGITDMVNPFTGDFSYSIPLMEVDGYPINLAYSSGITSDQEASWVGLGWNINPGSITRSMRGLPDDFSGDVITKEYNMKENRTVGATIRGDLELFEKELDLKKLKEIGISLGYSLGISCNNYNGYNIETGVTPSISATNANKGKLNASLGITSGMNGLTVAPSIGYEHYLAKTGTDANLGLSIGTSFNSRSGLTALTINASAKKGNQWSGGAGTAIAFNLNSYTPTINMPMRNFAADFSIKFGGTLQEIFGNIRISGFISEQSVNLNNGILKIPGYGYVNSHNVRKTGRVVQGLMDINRDWDSEYNLNTPSLPVTNFTYDILNVSGEGVSGSFRPFRNDYGYVSDNLAYNVSSSNSFGGELGGGMIIKGGIDLNINSSQTRTSTWAKDNDYVSKNAYRQRLTNDPLFEPYTYKQVGELSVDEEPGFFEAVGKDEAARIKLEGSGFDIVARNKLVNSEGTTVGNLDYPRRNSRLKRNQTLEVITYGEKQSGALNSNDDPIYQAPSHHPAEFRVVRNDGARYVYGIPAYNLTQEETSFAIGLVNNTDKDFYDVDLHLATIDKTKGIIGYVKESDNTVRNKKGINNYYSSTILPPYAYSYLLTAVLSPDYVDADNIIGPSDGDIGNYTVFQYEKLDEAYQWRTPYGQSEANFNEMLRSNNQDDQANYVYGKKEIWYLKSIESKHTIAIFHTEDRKDGYGVKGRDGGRGDASVTTKRLNKISLYHKKAYLDDPQNAVPIKEVTFNYKYTLCPNVQNNNGQPEMVNGQNVNATMGKLTLTSIYFTYGNSFKSKFSPYEFDYTNIYDNQFNPAYGMKNYDRWGNYKPNDINGLNNAEFPYVGTDKSLVDKYATAWTLSSITLPSGGKINIECESDDYAYVQDKVAMEMLNITSLNYLEPASATSIDPDSNLLMKMYQKFGINSNKIHKYLTFKLIDPIASSGNPEQVLYDKYLKGIKEMYFKFLVDITSPNHSNFEYVSGFLEMDFDEPSQNPNQYGLFNLNGSNEYQHAWIKISSVSEKDNGAGPQVHPISKSAWHFGRVNMPKETYNKNPGGDGCGVDDFIASIEDQNFVKGIIEAFKGANGYLKDLNCGKVVDISKSFIRLNTPERAKLGGGLRVKRIVSTDEWSTMAGGNNFTETYGMEYTYTKTDPETGNVISSGVAQYEPGVGGDENPFKMPVWHGNKTDRLLVPHDKSFLMGPAAESYYPSPSVGYERVEIKSLSHQDINRHATGKTVKEFYTAREYPTIVQSTTIDPRDKKTNPFFNLFKLYYREYMNVSQGYVVELNDMHGKPKAEWVYQEGALKPISGVEYRYQSKNINKTSSKLENLCNVVHPDGSVSQKEIGVEFDFIADFREQETNSVSGGVKANGGAFLAAFIPGFVPFMMPSYSEEHTRFRSAVITKVIYRYGIMEQTIAHDLGAAIATSNHAYDSETGLVLLTSTTNNFEDTIYTFNYPAHWYYDLMGQAYKNQGISFKGLSFDMNGTTTITDAYKYFVPGDEVIGQYDESNPNYDPDYNNQMLGWVESVNGNQVTFINEMGKAFFMNENQIQIKLIRSGRRNQIGISMGSIISNKDPLDGLLDNRFEKILNASVQEFRNDWQIFCECFDNPNAKMKLSSNPYVNGNLGVWRPFKSHAYLTPREHTWKNTNTNIRKDGYFEQFNPFWSNNNGTWGIDQDNWTWTAEITMVSPYGAELEEKDALGRFSSAIYGYNRVVPIAIGQNTAYGEIAFDGFEDYDYITCSDDHFSYRGLAPAIIADFGHTGYRYLQVNNLGIEQTKQLIICPPQ